MNTLRALLIEDSPADARLLIELTRRPGRVNFAIRHEERLDRALEALGRETFDVVILDLGLPDSTGLETLSRVLEAAPHMPIVVSTGQADEEVGLEAMRLGAQEFVSKNHWNHEVLTRVLRYAVERKSADLVLHQSEKQYQQLFDAHPDPLWVYDQETYAFLAANQAAILQYGWSREEFLTMTVPDLLPPDERSDVLSALAMARRDQAVRTLGAGGVWTHVKRDGGRIEIEGASSPIRFAGRPARLILAADVTERRRFEKQLIETQKMEAVAQLAGGIAHDFNNLVTVILGHCDLQAAEPGANSASFGQIRQAAQRAADLTRQLLTFSRKQVVQPRVLDLNEELGTVERLLRPLLGEAVELTTRTVRDLWSIKVDRGQLEQALLNLAVNAKDAMPRGGKLSFVTANVHLDEAYVRIHPGVAPGPYVELAVSDTGEGIEPEILARIFEPFFTTKPIGKGTGLGLATVHGVVTQGGGHLSVESEVGLGTTFHIYLPRAEAASTAARAPREESVTGGPETVLVVEDVEQLRSLVGLFLKSAGYRVIEAADPAQAMERLRQESGTIHCLLTDVVMPQKSGPELAEEVRRERGDVRTLFMSGYATEAIGQHGILDSETHFLQKPFSRKALLRKLREVLDGPARPPG